MDKPNGLETIEGQKFLPEVKIETADIGLEAKLFYNFIMAPDGRWLGAVEELHPELIKNLAGVESESKGIEICREFVENLHKINEEKLQSVKELFLAEWHKIEKEFFSTLAAHFETDWPLDKPEIVGRVSVLPVFPRYLDKYTYYLGCEDISRMIETSAHEIVHFLWFKKWQEVFPEIKRREYESPHLVWRLSEIIDPIILQCQPKIKELVKPKAWGYPSFRGIKIGDLSMTGHFKKIYLDSISAGNDFSTTIKLLWEEAQKHEKEISNF